MAEPDKEESRTVAAVADAPAAVQEDPAIAADPKPIAVAAPAEDPLEALQARLAKAEKERGETHERMLRIAAEFENFKKRSRRDAEDAGNRGRETLAKELLAVLDNMERALSALGAGGSIESLGQGVKLVDKQLHGVLEKFEIKSFDALGDAFDPARHEAIQQMETTEHPAGSVCKVFARGYNIGARLLRPAMVAVAKAPPRSETPAPSTDPDGSGTSGAESSQT